MNCSLPGSYVHEVFQARILEWFAISSSRGSSWPRVWTWDSWPPAGQVGSLPLFHSGFPGGSDGKESACSAGDSALIPGLGKFPWRWEWQPTPVRLPGESRGLVGYRLWSLKCQIRLSKSNFTGILIRRGPLGRQRGHNWYVCAKERPCENTKKVAVCKPRRETSGKTNLITFDLRFLASRNVRR